MANENNYSFQLNGLSVVSGRIPENDSVYRSDVHEGSAKLPGLPEQKKVLGLQNVELFDVELNSFPSKSGDVQGDHAISKGVLLSARFPKKQNVRSGSDSLIQGLKASETKNKEWKPPPIVKPMSMLRKIVFVLSFLPSILFVVGFAVIFPCREVDLRDTCTTEAWTLFLNNTALVADIFGISNGLVVGISSGEKDHVISIDKHSGETIWEKHLDSRLDFIDCSYFDVNSDGISECLTTEKSGIIRVLNASNGNEIANIKTNHGNLPKPAILPGCDDNDTQIISIATIPSIIRILRNDLTEISSLTIKECQDTPRNLLAWNHHSQTDLVFICKSNQGLEEVRLLRNNWCERPQTTSISSQALISFSHEANIKSTLFLPCPEGFVVWMEQFLIYFDVEGKELWRSNFGRYDERFLIYGNYSNRKQVVAIGVMENIGSQITIINVEDGRKVSVRYIPKYEVQMFGKISGRKQDYIILMLEGFLDNRMFMDITASFDFPGSHRRSNKSFIFHGMKASALSHMIKQRIVLLNFEEDESAETISEQEISAYTYDIFRRSDNDAAKLSVYTISEDEEMILNILVGKTVLQLQDNILQNNTYIKSVNAKSWDQSLSRCRYK